MRKTKTAALLMIGMLAAVTAVPQSAHAQAPANAAPAVNDAEIAAIVVTANAIDAEVGALAGEQATNAEVRAFGTTMVRDHNAVNEQAVALVTKLGVKPVESDVSRSLRADADKFRAELEQLKGAKFDVAYMEHEVAYHGAVIAAVDVLVIPSPQKAQL